MASSSPDNVRSFTVAEDDDGIRLDRWFKRHLPDTSFNIVSRWARTGQLRIDGKRVAPFVWRLVIPYPRNGAKLDIFELTPVADQPK